MTDSDFPDHERPAGHSRDSALDETRSAPEPAVLSGDAPPQPDADAPPEESASGDTVETHDLVGGDPYASYAEPVADPYEGAVPPGYDWPTHGGYLGCLLGVVMACVLGGFLGSLLIGLLSVSPLAVIVSSSPARIVVIVAVFLVTLAALGRTGWRLGRRFYREYPLPASRPQETHGHVVR